MAILYLNMNLIIRSLKFLQKSSVSKSFSILLIKILFHLPNLSFFDFNKTRTLAQSLDFCLTKLMILIILVG